MGLISKEGLELIKKLEGFYDKPYYDIAGVKTLGYGMTGDEIKGLLYISKQQASDMLEKLINNNYAPAIKRDLDSKGVKLKQNEFDALVSMSYNIGVYGLLHSTLYKNICSGIRDMDTITSNFEMWCKYKSGKIYKTSDGLLKRRRIEAQFFLGSKSENNTESLDGKMSLITGNSVRVRSQMDTSNADNILGKLYKGDRVKIFKREGNWYHIYYGKSGGYVFGKYVKLL